MSITYALYSASDRRPDELLERLGAGLGVKVHLHSVGEAVTTDAVEGLDVSANRVKPPVDAFVREDFGVAPKVRLTLRLHKDDLSRAQEKVVDVLVVVMGQSADDLVLLREDESVAFRRLDGQREVGEDPLWAEPARRAKLDRAQRRRNIQVG